MPSRSWRRWSECLRKAAEDESEDGYDFGVRSGFIRVNRWQRATRGSPTGEGVLPWFDGEDGEAVFGAQELDAFDLGCWPATLGD